MDLRVLLLSIWVALTTGYSLRNQQLFFLPPSLSTPERVPELGLTPRYSSLVYDYISKMAGYRSPVQGQWLHPVRVEDFGVRNAEPALPDVGEREPVTEGPLAAGAPQPLQPSHLLPSDFILLTRSPQSQFFGSFDVVKNNKMVESHQKESAYPPVGGVVSNYILQRQINDKVKRQTYEGYYNDGSEENVVINSSEPKADKNSTDNSDSEESKEEPQPSVAQSKPQAIALAGVGGVAQAAPVATAIVGKDGLAIAAPSATAVAGQGTQGAIQLGGEEKMRLSGSKPSSSSSSEKEEKKEKPSERRIVLK